MAKLKIAAIVLAAGQSRRFGDANKLWHKLEGIPLVEHTLKLLGQCCFNHVIIVGSTDDHRLEDSAYKHQFRFVCNSNSNDGIGTSIACGVAALDPDTIDGIAVFLGDTPFLKHEDVQKLCARFVANDGLKIVRPVFRDQPGHPVLFPKSLLSELRELRDDTGAKEIIQANQHRVEFVVQDNSTCNADIDTLADVDDASHLRPDGLPPVSKKAHKS